ncbi:hypothetical protein GXP71_15500 [Cellulomonas sp. H30R-01]|uniref:hypothetical protein n=1 Tax=Cellulomonas sp. H30R-01 TaxID=2704467 RepID=UPI00138B2D4F|nr:hypothetical protein [Cellulomonas sp. H30R-01]QHT57338.1 hypothetical protein GXP71_15500 [Cellulomonas sp. H30R-01]
MRNTTLTSTIVLCALTLAGCAGGPEPVATAEPGVSAPATSPSPTASAATDVAPDVMLTEAAWTVVGPGAPRDESTGVVDWRLPEACAAGDPTGASAMRTVSQGSGEFEAPVGVQQVAVLADADAAVAEAERLTAALGTCTEGEPPTRYVAEPLAVGAQGLGLATDYYGASASGALDDAMGTYVAVTRRGNAVMLVGLDGGEGTVGSARTTVSGLAQQGWELLCPFDSAGC